MVESLEQDVMSGDVEKCPILHVRPKFDVFTLLSIEIIQTTDGVLSSKSWFFYSQIIMLLNWLVSIIWLYLQICLSIQMCKKSKHFTSTFKNELTTCLKMNRQFLMLLLKNLFSYCFHPYPSTICFVLKMYAFYIFCIID